MSKHFEYLMDDDSGDFFQKLACEAVDQQIVPATASTQVIEKVAAANGIQKLAARVGRDIDIIKTAGESGYNFGAVQRGLGYIDGLVYRDQLDAEYGAEIFDKVASATIEHDLSIIHANLLKTAGEEYRDWVDHTVADIGMDLAEAAALEKEAFISSAIKAYKAVRKVGLGRGAATKAAIKSPAQSFKKWRTNAATAKRGKAATKLKNAVGKAELASGAQAAKLRAARSIKDPAVRRSVLPGVEQKAVNTAQKGQKKIQKAQANLSKREGKLKQRQAIEAGQKPAATAKTQGTKTVENKAAETKADMAVQTEAAKNEATIASKGGKNKDPGATQAMTKAEKETAISKGGDSMKEDATMLGSLGKLKDKGWANLSPAERSKVLQAGAGAYIAKEQLA